MYFGFDAASFTLHFAQAWPAEALEMVANKYLEELEMSNEVRKELVELCKLFQESSRVLANKCAPNTNYKCCHLPGSTCSVLRVYSTCDTVL